MSIEKLHISRGEEEPDYEEVSTYDQERMNRKRSRRLKIIGASVVAAVVAFGGSLLYTNRDNGERVAAQPVPSASAPLDPTEQPSTPTSEAPSDIEATDIEGQYDLETFPLSVEGEDYAGLTDFQEKNELLVKDYEGEGQEKRLLDAFVAQAGNPWLHSATDPETMTKYKDAVSEDEALVGPAAIGQDVYDKVFNTTFAAPGSEFTTVMAQVHSGHVRLAEQYKDSNEPYDAAITTKIYKSFPHGTGTDIILFVKWTQKDNKGFENSTNRRITFTQMKGAGGEKVYKVDQFELDDTFAES